MTQQKSPLSSRTLLLVDDEPYILQMLQETFSLTEFNTLLAYDGTSALRIVENYTVDLALLDMQLPDMKGTELLQHIHQRIPHLPCLFLTGIAEEAEVVKGLELGAEDYIIKPFRPQELVARIHKVLNRGNLKQEQVTTLSSSPPIKQQSTTLASPNYNQHQLWIHEGERQVKLKGVPLVLTRLEFDLLYLLVRHENQVLTRGQILDHLWPDSLETGHRAVDTHIKHLRHKLHDSPTSPTYIQTIRGVGYSFRPQMA